MHNGVYVTGTPATSEQKELIRAENGATRDLINATNQQNLRDTLDQARDELNLLKLRASLPPALTPAVTV